MKKPTTIFITRLLTFAFFLILVITLASSNQVFAASIPQKYVLAINQNQDTKSNFLDFGSTADQSTNIAVFSKPDSPQPQFAARAGYRVDEFDWNIFLPLFLTSPTPFDCPQAGNWSGTTSQGREISFEVERTPTCQIKGNTLTISVKYDFCGTLRSTSTYWNSYAITNHLFQTGSGTTISWVAGSFTTTSAANGTFYAYTKHLTYGSCSAAGTWTASPDP